MTSARGARKWLLMRRWRESDALGAERARPIIGAASVSAQTTEYARYLEIIQRQPLGACIDGVSVGTFEYRSTCRK